MKNIARLIRKYALTYKKEAIRVLTLVALVSMFELISPRLIQYIIDEGIEKGSITAIGTGAGLMVVAALLSAGATIRQAIESARLSQGTAYDLRNDLFTRIQHLSFTNIDRLQTGQLMTRVSSDVDIVRMFIGMGTPMLTRVTILIIGSLVLMFTTNARLAFIVVLFMLVLIALFLFVASKAAPLFRVVQEKLAVVNTFVQENLAGVDVVKAFVREDHQIEGFEARNNDYLNTTLKVQRILTVAFPLILVIANLASLTILSLGGRQVIEGTLSVGQLVAFNSYLMTAIFPIMLLGMVISLLSSAEASALRIHEVFDTETRITIKTDAINPGKIAGKVEFRDVSFTYRDECCEDQVLHDISFTALPGQRIALIGATGSGKSSLISLIPRFYDPQAGQVLVDDVDVRDLDLYTLRSQIGMVLQQTILFSGTIRENIAYGRPDAPVEEIEAAAKAAQAHEFIMAMPDGYDSQVESRGANLSGGQKQRLAIARALLVNPAILILDDSTSSVDMETEMLIQDALDVLMSGRTTFIIAQRLSSVLTADIIIVLENGRITASGKHADLLRTSEIYREIYHSQIDENALRHLSESDSARQIIAD